MKRQSAIVKDQLKGFEEELLAVEHDRHLTSVEKSKMLLGVQLCMYVFTSHMESRDAEAFKALHSASFRRVLDAWEAKLVTG